jgi:hypothetical protein
MARFYAHYQNTTVSALEASSGTNYYDRRAVNTTNAATARTNLLGARDTLSAQFYADIATASNKNGNLGIVVPTDAMTNNGTTVSGSNIYTDTTPTPAALWQSDPRTRPTAQILIANTESTIVDAWDVTTLAYNDCLTYRGDYMTAITGGSPYTRLGTNPWRTLASMWHDHDMTYFAWDDYTPGQPTSVTISGVSTAVVKVTGLNNYEFRADALADIEVNVTGTINGQSVNVTDTASPGAGDIEILHAIACNNGDAWSLTANVTYKYTVSSAGIPSPFASSGAVRSVSSSGTVAPVT